jgi:hypothetical protein
MLKFLSDHFDKKSRSNKYIIIILLKKERNLTILIFGNLNKIITDNRISLNKSKSISNKSHRLTMINNSTPIT